MASDVGCLATLITELAEVRRQREAFADTRHDAREELRLLERTQPGWYRLRARTEHADATASATQTVESTDRALLGLDSREHTLLEQIARERAAREPERVRERAVRTRAHGRGMELWR